jgi:uncharacterized protein (TIGR02996 family)
VAHPLDSVEEALEAGNIDDALTAMLAVWRDKRAPAYADAIDALGAAASAAIPRFEGDDNHIAWMELSRNDRLSDIDVLLDGLLKAPVSTLAGRVEQLCERPEDPRIAMIFAKMAQDPPTTSSSNFPIWTKVFGALKAANDPRVVPLLQARLKEKPGGSKFWPKLYGNLEKIVAGMPQTPALTADETKRAAAIAKSAGDVEPSKTAGKSTKKTAAKADYPFTLEGAVEAAKAGELRACLNALLAVWRTTRFGEYGAAIERVSGILNDGIAPPWGKKLGADWAALAAKRDIADVGRLADSALDGKPSEAEPRLDEMVAWPEDPRIGRAVLLAMHTSYFSDRSRAWKLTSELIVRNCDKRFVESMPEFAESGTDNKAERSAKRRTAPLVTEAMAKLPNALPEANAALLKKLDAALDAYEKSLPSTERRFLEDILASPDEDGPRQVYADWLTERGNPRGEYMSLQLQPKTPATEKRIKELHEQAARALIGPGVAIIWSNLSYSLTRDPIMQRGLLTRAELRFGCPDWLIVGQPLLWFLEEVSFTARRPGTNLAVIRTTRSLRSLDNVSLGMLNLLARSPSLAIEEVRLVHPREVEDPLEAYDFSLGVTGLTKLKKLEFYWGSLDHNPNVAPRSLLAAPALKNLEELAISVRDLGAVLAEAERNKIPLKKITFMQRYYLVYRVEVDLEAEHITIAPLDDRDTDVRGSTCEGLFATLDSLPKWKRTIDPRLKFDAATKERLNA